ncbi:MAG: hypothetical protein IH881_15690 [Myxococcales bacterium]|nr:hypothetical protein [Myxococcales bacterium]
MHTSRSRTKTKVSHLVTFVLILLFSILSSSSQALAGTKLYTASWIAESFGNDIAGIGTGDSRYFSFYAIPFGYQGHSLFPLCDLISTPYVTTPTGTMFNPLGGDSVFPGCRLLTASETRPPKFGTETPLGGSCPGAPASPCSKTAPLYRNAQFFDADGLKVHDHIQGYTTIGKDVATTYLGPGNALRGQGMKGAPVAGGGSATTSAGTAPGKFSFNFPAANPSPATDGFRMTTTGSFPGVFPYLYSYTYANMRNDVGNFGVGKGFFSTGASTPGGNPRTMATYTLKIAGGPVQTTTITRGTKTFGGVMKLLGSYSTKVCYFYGGGCALGYGTWQYELIGAAGKKNVADKNHPKASSVVDRPFTTTKTFMYFNTATGSNPKYTNVAERWPWTTGTVTVKATGRGQHDTFVRREGFDNRDPAGVGTLQLVSPVVTQWLGGTPASMSETGGVAIMQIRFVPEPGVFASLICGIALLMVLKRYHA